MLSFNEQAQLDRIEGKLDRLIADMETRKAIETAVWKHDENGFHITDYKGNVTRFSFHDGKFHENEKQT